MPEGDIGDQLLRGQRRQTKAIVFIFAVLVALIIYVGVQGSNTHMQEAQSHAALCTFRADLRQRVRDSEKFLRNHPHGFAGISSAVIRTSLNGQRRTIKALSPLRCKD